MRFVRLLAVTSLALAGSAGRPLADEPSPPPDFFYELPAGIGCSFELLLEGWQTPNTVNRELKGVNGSALRLLIAGKGNTLRFTNVATGATYSLMANGATEMISVSADGVTYSYDTAGHMVLIMFPSDVPAGPSTTLYVGRLLFSIDANTGLTTFESFAGKSADICALLE